MFKSGNGRAALLIKEIISTFKRTKKIRKSLSNPNLCIPIIYTGNEALLFLVDNRLIKKQYSSVRIDSKNRKSNIYPPHEQFLTAKKTILSEKYCNNRI